MIALSPLMSCEAEDVCGTERVEAVDEGDADVDFGGLAVLVSGGDALAEGFQAPHLCLCPASRMVAAPPLPSRAALFANAAQNCVSRDGGRAVFPPELPVLADRDYGPVQRAREADDAIVNAAIPKLLEIVREHGPVPAVFAVLMSGTTPELRTAVAAEIDCAPDVNPLEFAQAFTRYDPAAAFTVREALTQEQPGQIKP